ncbi:MAG: SCO family protein [Gemmatimonadaceae bacterium]
MRAISSRTTPYGAAALFAAALLGACSNSSPARDPDAAVAAALGSLRGSALARPVARPAFVLRRSDGASYDFAQETTGRVTLLFFGYTYCPDICPLHMANIAAVLKKLSWEERQAISVVFVTTDPERDTPERLRQWLADFDPSFVGLRGPIAEVNRIQQSLGLPPAAREAGADSRYLVGHAAQVLAFAKDDSARAVYPFGTRQEDWAHDLPILADEPPQRSPLSPR